MIVPPIRERVVVDGSGNIICSRPARPTPVWRLYAPLKGSVRGIKGQAAASSSNVLYHGPVAGQAPALASFGSLTNQVWNPNMGSTYTGGVANRWFSYIPGSATGTLGEDTETPGLVSGQGQKIERTGPLGSGNRIGVTANHTNQWTATTSYYLRVRCYVRSVVNDATTSPANRVGLIFTGYSNVTAVFDDNPLFTLDEGFSGWIDFVSSGSGKPSFDGGLVYVYIDLGQIDLTVDTVDLFVGQSSAGPHFSGEDDAASWATTAYNGDSVLAALDLSYDNSHIDPDGGHVAARVYLPALPGSAVQLFDGAVDVTINGGTVTATADGSTNLSGGDLQAGTWHHIALVWDADTGEQYLYIDGVLIDSDSYTAPGSYADDLQVGAAAAGGSDLGGWIQDLTMGQRALTSEEVGALFSQADTIPGKTADILLSRAAGSWSASQPKSEGVFNVAYVGGSVVNGAGATAGQSFRERLGRWMDHVWPGSTLTHYNMSTGGTSSFYRLQRVQDIIDLKPRIIVIDNVNELQTNIDYDISAEALLRRLRAGCPQAYILGIWPYWPSAVDGTNNAAINRTAIDKWSAICDELDIAYYDFAEYAEAQADAGAIIPSDWLADTIHPSDAGYEQMYLKLLSYLAEHVGPQLIASQWTGSLADYSYIGDSSKVAGMMLPPTEIPPVGLTIISGTWATASPSALTSAIETTDAGATVEFKAIGRWYGMVGYATNPNAEISLDGGQTYTSVLRREVLIDAGSRQMRTVRIRNISGTFRIEAAITV